MVKLVVGPFASNSYILGCEITREGVIIDPGDDGETIISQVEKNNIKITKLLHTHAHYDHVGATAILKKKYPTAEVSLHREDVPLYSNLLVQAGLFGLKAESPTKVERFLNDGDIITFGNFSLKVIHTPGHSPGGVCYLLTDHSGIFSGDTLFRRSIGRTDLWGGSHEQLITSIKEKLFILNRDIKVFPGHGDETTIGEEMEGNPFF